MVRLGLLPSSSSPIDDDDGVVYYYYAACDALPCRDEDENGTVDRTPEREREHATHRGIYWNGAPTQVRAGERRWGMVIVVNGVSLAVVVVVRRFLGVCAIDITGMMMEMGGQNKAGGGGGAEGGISGRPL